MNNLGFTPFEELISRFRQEHPTAVLATEIVQHSEENNAALFRAEITLPVDSGKATGWGFARGGEDYIHDAEDRAMRRALRNLLGAVEDRT